MARTKKISRPEIKALKTEHFRPSDELGLSLPRLVLVTEPDVRSLFDGDARDYAFKPGRDWLKIEHQTAGHRCNQRYLIGTVLTPKNPEVSRGMVALARKWFNSQAARGENPLDALIDYRADLKSFLNADCNDSHGKMEEGLMPIDIQFLPQLVTETLPKDLDDLILFDTGWERAAGCADRWQLYVVSVNSD